MIVQLVAAVAGLVVMVAPPVIGYGGTAADVDHIVGPVAIAVGIMAASEILRPLRWLGAGLGAILAGSVFFVARPLAGSMVVVVAAATMIVTASVRGRLHARFGGGWSALWRADRRAA